MQPKKIEHYKFFQPIAWTLCLGFAGFVGMLALEMTSAVQEFENSSVSFEQRLQNLEQKVEGSPEAD